MDLNTKVTLLFGVLATVLAIVGIWAALQYNGRRCQYNNQPIVTNILNGSLTTGSQFSAGRACR